MILIVTAATLLLAALAVFLQRRFHRQRAALPRGALLTSDNTEQPCPVLVSTRYGLKGKPDAVIRTPDGLFVPVERKHSRAPLRPHDSDIIQAAAYCVLIEEHYGQTPPFMRIDYNADSRHDGFDGHLDWSEDFRAKTYGKTAGHLARYEKHAEEATRCCRRDCDGQ